LAADRPGKCACPHPYAAGGAQCGRAAESEAQYRGLLIEKLKFTIRKLKYDRFGHDTTVPILAKSKTPTGRLWTYVRDDRPFAGPGPPAAVFFYSRDRGGEHPEQHLAGFAGLMQADAYAGFNRLYEVDQAPIIEAACWAHARRNFFDPVRINKAPIVSEAVAASMPCSRSSARSTAWRRRNAWPRAPSAASRSSSTWRTWLRGQRARVSKSSGRQGHRLQPQALDHAHPLPRRRPPVRDQQCRRA